MKTGYIFIGLMLLSVALEIWLGVQVVTLYWSYPAPGGSLAQELAQASDTVITLVQGHRSLSRVSPLSATFVLTWWVHFYLFFHVFWAVLSLLWPRYERGRLGARQPSERERQQYEAVLLILAKQRADMARPRYWLVADGPGLRMRWIGYVLVIDRPLLFHRGFAPLLAHELGHVNGEDRLARRLYAMIPEKRALLLLLLGLPASCGVLLLYPAWMWYWRRRIFAADAYAVTLAQGHALIRTLTTLYLPLDRLTKFGRWLRPVPYTEERVRRIEYALANRATYAAPRVI